MGGWADGPGGCPVAVEAGDVGQINGLFQGSAECLRGASGDDGPCPGNCCGGNI